MRNTPLHIAVLKQQALIVKTVIELGADPLVKNAKGLTAIDLAIDVGCSPFIMQLLRSAIMRLHDINNSNE